ncbi:extracellular solute-binding protein [Murimonas intestini]|uniref:Carbohydrate ABC transporter substrate-binding protein (CUT1 family) n=1 Tax=Murimonas intestini TaxID=1337051 RepID=A0AB73SXS8_9FIRM|nr:extracellular solute-binding protein [Murimonas intestini]MCR1865718.1 extracellular solute-binding protein [Murimonas intestini]MCR1886163.1 extracellular solute-binding protein [Murimonas intestini]
MLDRKQQIKKERVWLMRTAALAGALTLALGGCASGEKQGASAASAEQEVILSAFVQQAVTSDSGIWEGWAAQKLYNDTNLKVDFYATGTEVEQKLKQYIAAGTLPDIIGFKDLDQAQLAMDAGLLVPLDEYKDKLPAIFGTEEYQSAISYSMENTSNNTGKLYIMPTSVGPVSYNAYNWVPMLQWDAYKQAGMPKINTLEDYLDVVEKMVELKPYTDSGEKVYGFSLFSDWDKYSALEIAALSYFYGIDTEYVSPLMETNVVTKETNCILREDSFYKRALRFYFMANQRGLLDPDSMTQSYSSLDKKFSEGRIMFSWFSWLSGTYNIDSSGHVNNAQRPDGYANVPAGDMKIYEAPDQIIGRNWYFAISKNCREIDKACEFLNWIYDPEVERYLYNGPEGGVWNYNEDGEPVVTEEGWHVINNKAEDIMPVRWGGAFQDGTYLLNALGLQASTIMDDGYTIGYRYWPSSLNANATLMQKEVNEMLGTDTLAEYLYKNDMVAKSTIAVNMIPPASDEMETRINAIGEIVRDYSWQMVYAKDNTEFESLWTVMVEKAEKQGLYDVESYYKNAWENALTKAAEYE